MFEMQEREKKYQGDKQTHKSKRTDNIIARDEIEHNHSLQNTSYLNLSLSITNPT